MLLLDRVICGDSREVLTALPDGCIDAVCTDPPYALLSSRNGKTGFMNQKWDTGQVAHDPAFWTEVLRVAKPGAFLLAFGGCRTYHRLVCAIEDAGWEIRDQIVHWIYGSGFPKSKSCLKPSQEPIVLAKAPGPLQPLQIDACRLPTGEYLGRPVGTPVNAYEWSKVPNPMAGQVTSEPAGRWPPNLLLSHQPGCQPAGVRRVKGAGWRDTDVGPPDKIGGAVYSGGTLGARGTGHHTDADGYETVDAYQCVDGCPVKLLDEQAGPRTSGHWPRSKRGAITGWSGGWNDFEQQERHAEPGRASRFFPTFAPDPEDAVPFRYCSKASRRDRNAGLEGRPKGLLATMNDGIGVREHNPEQPTPWAANDHPTCKPTALMAWLCKLVTPPGGTVLDCFAGSGSTLVACVREGFGFIGIEQDSRYVSIAKARISHAHEQAIASASQPVQPHLPLALRDCDKSDTE